MAIAWTPPRQRLLDLLVGLHEDLADMYRLAIEMFASDPLTQVEMMVGAHCVREFAPAFVEVQGLNKPDRADASGAARELWQAWQSFGLEVDEAPDDPKFSDTDLRQVPSAVYAAARQVAKAGQGGAENARKVTALVALGEDADMGSPTVSQLHEALDFFRKWMHHRDYRQPAPKLPPVESIDAQLQVFEAALLTRLANRADRVRDLQAILERANRPARVEG
jgi:hypothetical protein